MSESVIRISGVVVASAIAAAALLVSVGSAEGNRGASCANANEPATVVSTGELRKAVQCLINQERRSRDRAELKGNRKLTGVASKHVRKMVATDCLDHVCGDEAGIETRIRRSGYFSGARDFDFGENVGCRHSAAEMVDYWMASRLHRENILERKFDHIGVAADHGRVPSSCSEGYATFVAVFGHRAG